MSTAFPDNWHEWKGGSRPVLKSAFMEVELRDGSRTQREAGYLAWMHENVMSETLGTSDIVRYRCIDAANLSDDEFDAREQNPAGFPAPRGAGSTAGFPANMHRNAPDTSWIEWHPRNRFDLPLNVEGDDVVGVRYRSGGLGWGPTRSFAWGKYPAEWPDDIVAYNIIRPAARRGLHDDLIDAIEASDTCERMAEVFGKQPRPHSHYYKDVAHLDTIDVYRVLSLFSVTDPCLQHAVKKLLVAGGRGAGKDITRDVQEAIDSLKRWQGMRDEDTKGVK